MKILIFEKKNILIIFLLKKKIAATRLVLN